MLLLRGDAVPGVNRYRSWPKYRPGYDMPFRGCDAWNAARYKDHSSLSLPLPLSRFWVCLGP